MTIILSKYAGTRNEGNVHMSLNANETVYQILITLNISCTYIIYAMMANTC